MALKKSFGEGSKKIHKSRAQEDEPGTMDNAFPFLRGFESSFKLKGGKTFLVYDKLNTPLLSSISTPIFNIKRCILNKVKLDLAFYIAWHMDHVSKRRMPLFPMVSTSPPFLKKFEINLSGKRKTRKVIHSDVYGITTMKQMQYSLKENIWVKRDAIVEEELDEEAQMEGNGAQEDEEAMHEDEEPPTVPPMAPSSSHANEDNFQLMFGRMDFMATSMENLTNLVTNQFSAYDANFATLAQTMEDINEHLRNHGI
uniref:Uncharacterized protein n=1 Tax=Fagus sylvatica TaxID=28930 RepID=A0A2N9G0U4_FAGSY